MKERTKGFVAGVVIAGAVMGSLGGVLADDIYKEVSVAYSNIKIYLDGNKLEPKDANGNTVEPFTLDGTTYLPVRAVAAAFGKEVEWDGETNTVYLGKKPTVVSTGTGEATPKEYQNALSKAKSYSDLMHMSKKRLYNQLVSEYGEKFSPDAAQYAVDNLQVDYKINALEKAKSYQDMMNMSKDRIYDQLVSEYGEQFTPEEARYAVDHLED